MSSPRAHVFVLAALIAIVVAGAVVDLIVPQYNTQANDIYFTFLEGKRLAAGENPYTRILGGSMQVNDKYPTYLPLFYMLSAVTVKLGIQDYLQWMSVWRAIFLLADAATGALLAWFAYRRTAAWLAIVTALLWSFSRWNLMIGQVGNMEPLPLLCLVLAVCLLKRRPVLAYVMLGISLALKQIGVLLVPLFLISAWQAAPAERKGRLLAALAGILGIPLLVSLPFLAWNADGFVRSIAFSITRNAAAHLDAPSVDSLLGLSGIPARLILFGILAIVYAAFWRRELGLGRAGLLVMAVFVNFNPVLFLQYFTWVMVWLPIAIVEDRPVRAGETRRLPLPS